MNMTLFQVRDKDGVVRDIWVGAGADGYTPVRGEDYFTSEDVAEIVAQASAEAKSAAVEEALSVISAPTLLPQDTWYKGATARTAITEIRVLDSFTPAETDVVVESWPADIDGKGNIMCYVLTNAAAGSTVLVMAGNGSGRIMANADSKKLFAQFSNVVGITGLAVIDTRYVETLLQAFAFLDSLATLEGYENWDVRNCVNYKALLAHDGGCYNAFTADFSNWGVSCAVGLTSSTNNVFANMFYNCLGMQRVSFHKSFDMTYIPLPVPKIDGKNGVWLDTATNETYADNDGDKTITTKDGLPNPLATGRSITFVAVNLTPEPTEVV
jgi:hypothetical protein